MKSSTFSLSLSFDIYLYERYVDLTQSPLQIYRKMLFKASGTPFLSLSGQKEGKICRHWPLDLYFPPSLLPPRPRLLLFSSHAFFFFFFFGGGGGFAGHVLGFHPVETVLLRHWEIMLLPIL